MFRATSKQCLDNLLDLIFLIIWQKCLTKIYIW